MCGIIGYYGKKEAILDTLLSGLKRLEYRGYDSSGVAIVTPEHNVYCKKATGRIINLENFINQDNLPEFDSVGIAHTRWATHGMPTETNAHPHRSSDNKIWVVHNGIIENYKEIKDKLISQGYDFESQTDTEVIAKLIGSVYAGDLKQAVLEALTHLEGAYALAIVCSDEPGRLIGAKKGSPLLLGVAAEELILASDVSAIISKTRDVIYLEDNELVDIYQGQYEIMNLENQIIFKNLETVDWDEEAASKEGFDSFLAKEISEQKTAIIDSFRGRLVEIEANIRFGGLIDVMERLRDIDKIIVVGIGSSYFAAELGALYFEKLAGISCKAEMSTEFRYKDNVIDDKTWVIALSQSGETADTIGAINEAKQKGALVTGIVNVVGSTISRITDSGVYNHIGPEMSVASTKAISSQYLILLMHAILLGRMRDLGFSTALELIQEIQNLPKYFQESLQNWESVAAVAKKYHQASSFIYLGRRFNLPIAKEGSIKLKELSYIHSEAFSGGELKHGPIAMIDENLPTLAIATSDTLYAKQISSIAEIKARKGPVIALVNTFDPQLTDIVADQLVVPTAKSEEIQAIVNNIYLQIFAYEIAKIKGFDLDKPRNLAKSVTVE